MSPVQNSPRLANVTLTDGFGLPRETTFRMAFGTPLWYQMLHAAFSGTAVTILTTDKAQLFLRNIRSINAVADDGTPLLALETRVSQ